MATGGRPRTSNSIQLSHFHSQQLAPGEADTARRFPIGREQTQRGEGAKKRLAGHRDTAIEHAKGKLGAEDLAARIARTAWPR